MPDLIRHPEHTEITGFRLPDHVRHRPRRNDAFMGFQTFYETVKLPALKGGASRKGKYLFQIASLNPALKGGACREADRSKMIKSILSEF